MGNFDDIIKAELDIILGAGIDFKHTQGIDVSDSRDEKTFQQAWNEANLSFIENGIGSAPNKAASNSSPKQSLSLTYTGVDALGKLVKPLEDISTIAEYYFPAASAIDLAFTVAEAILEKDDTPKPLISDNIFLN